jgi:hypothetical protein
MAESGNGAVSIHLLKPKGMHWATFARLEARHDELVNQTMAGMVAKFGPLRELIGR